jgi:hypothetical protein
MTNNFLRTILEQNNIKNLSNKIKGSSGSFMMQAETAVKDEDTGKVDKYVKFFAVPEKMRQDTNQNTSLLLTSANVHELYGVPKNRYETDPEQHNKNAEQEFKSYQKLQRDIVSHVNQHAVSKDRNDIQR